MKKLRMKHKLALLLFCCFAFVCSLKLHCSRFQMYFVISHLFCWDDFALLFSFCSAYQHRIGRTGRAERRASLFPLRRKTTPNSITISNNFWRRASSLYLMNSLIILRPSSPLAPSREANQKKKWSMRKSKHEHFRQTYQTMNESQHQHAIVCWINHTTIINKELNVTRCFSCFVVMLSKRSREKPIKS
jgi:hypothetical protein